MPTGREWRTSRSGAKSDTATLANAIAANPQTLFVIAAGNEAEDNEVQPQYPCVYDPPAEGKARSTT